MHRRTMLLAAGAAALGAGRPMAAPAFPAHALKLIVPFPAGSSVGINARLLQPHLEHAIGQSVVPEFDQGSGGSDGHRLGAAAEADGYTLTMVSASLTVQPWINRASMVRPTDFAFIGQVTSFPSMLLVRPDSPYHTLADLVAAMHRAPDVLSTGILASWWPPALAQVLFFNQVGANPRIVSSYFTGAQMVVALAEGKLDFAVVGLADVEPSLNGVPLRALAVTTRTRAFPTATTFREQGWDVTAAWWRGLAVPAATPDTAVVRLRMALGAAMSSDALRADFERNALTVDPLDGPAFADLVLTEYQTFGALFSSPNLNSSVPRSASQ